MYQQFHSLDTFAVPCVADDPVFTEYPAVPLTYTSALYEKCISVHNVYCVFLYIQTYSNTQYTQNTEYIQNTQYFKGLQKHLKASQLCSNH
jgi:hypothetical protein